MPGTSSNVGNSAGNWESRLPPIEMLLSLQESLKPIVTRKPTPSAGTVIDMANFQGNENFTAQAISVREGETIIFQNSQGQWQSYANNYVGAIWQLAVTYTGRHSAGGFEDKEWVNLDLSPLELDPTDRQYSVFDLLASTGRSYPTRDILERGLSIGLNTSQRRHHFIIFPNI